MIQLFIVSAVVLGGLVSLIYGWKDSGEKFSGVKAIRTIIGIVIVCVGIAIPMFSANIEISNLSALIAFLFNAFMAGIAADYSAKRLTDKFVSK